MQMLLRKIHCKFQSTPPVKAATVLPFTKSTYATISIHAAREGGDKSSRIRQKQNWNFNPRRP